MRKLAVVVAAVAAFVVVGVAPASAQTPDAVSVARALIAAENAHDVNAVLNLFAPNAIVNLPTGVFVGRSEIEGWQRELAAGNFRADTTPPVAVTPEIVTFSGTVALDLFRQLGISSLESTWELTIQLGRVTVFNFNFTPAAGARLQAALSGGAAQAGGASSGGAQSGGGGSTSGSGAGAASGTGGATSTAARSLALTGMDPGLAGLGGATILIGAALLVTDRRWARSARRRHPVR